LFFLPAVIESMSRSNDKGETDNSISSKSGRESTRRRRHRKSSRSSREKSEKRKTKRRREDRRGDEGRRKERRRRQSSHRSDGSSESSKRRDRKKSSKEKKRRRKETENGTTANEDGTAIQFAKALYALLHKFEDMGEQLISMIYRMSSGTMFDLNQVNPPELRVLLTNVFATLQKYGVEQHQGGSWHWREATQPRADRKRLELLLIQVVRQLLNDVGLTMDAIDKFENEQHRRQQHQLDKEHCMVEHNKLLEALHIILDTFGKPDANPPIALELSGLFDFILQGEAVVLDGIPNEILKSELETLFQLVGLVKVKENVEDEDNLDGEIVYSLPEEEENKDRSDKTSAARNLAEIVRNECQHRVQEAAPSEKRSLIGPTFPTNDSQLSIQDEVLSSSSEESEGPAPEGTDQSARRALIQRRRITKEEARELANKRKYEIDVATGKLAASDVKSAIDGREEWMLTPGKHTFLEGIMKKGPTVNRQFKNEKLPRSGGGTAHIDPSVQKEMEELTKAKHQERGPSLFQLHQDKIAKEKAVSTGGKEEWKWSRDGDLDKGRRVDKNALRSILGGAEENLKTKFEGSFTSGFM